MVCATSIPGPATVARTTVHCIPWVHVDGSMLSPPPRLLCSETRNTRGSLSSAPTPAVALIPTSAPSPRHALAPTPALRAAPPPGRGGRHPPLPAQAGGSRDSPAIHTHGSSLESSLFNCNLASYFKN